MELLITLWTCVIVLSLPYVHTIDSYNFHTSYKSGEKTGTPIACAVECAIDGGCVGYEISNVSGCVLLTTPPAAPKDDHWIYASPERMAQIRYCPPIAARASNLEFYLHFAGEDTIYRFRLADTEDILAGVYRTTKLVSTEYPLLDGKGYTALYQTTESISAKKHVYAIIGSDIEVYEYDSAVQRYDLLPGYPRPLAEELGVQSVPASVNAMTKVLNMVYMLEGDIMYAYSVSGLSPQFNYAFVATFDIKVNSADNPFSAVAGSPLANPPGNITALVTSEDGGRTLAFSDTKLYVFYPKKEHWEYKGELTTPCG